MSILDQGTENIELSDFNRNAIYVGGGLMIWHFLLQT